MADEEYSCYGGRPRLRCGLSGDDDPQKVAHLEEVAKRRGWEKFSWREVLQPVNEERGITKPIINRNRK